MAIETGIPTLSPVEELRETTNRIKGKIHSWIQENFPDRLRVVEKLAQIAGSSLVIDYEGHWSSETEEKTTHHGRIKIQLIPPLIVDKHGGIVEFSDNILELELSHRDDMPAKRRLYNVDGCHQREWGASWEEVHEFERLLDEYIQE